MIRKYLVCGKQIFISSKKMEDQSGAEVKTPVCELLLPVSLYWEVETLLKRIDYLIASNEDPLIVHEMTQKVLRKVVKYAVIEKDRILLHDKIRGG